MIAQNPRCSNTMNTIYSTILVDTTFVCKTACKSISYLESLTCKSLYLYLGLYNSTLCNISKKTVLYHVIRLWRYLMRSVIWFMFLCFRVVWIFKKLVYQKIFTDHKEKMSSQMLTTQMCDLREKEKQKKSRKISIYVVHVSGFIFALGYSICFTGLFPYLNQVKIAHQLNIY